MTLKDQAAWDQFVSKNTDPYGKAIVAFAERWANLMEPQIKAGKTLAQVADKASVRADTEGITGFMYGCAVSTLAKTWEYGEDLRRWHNLDTQIGNEGATANDNGTVLNPALLTIAV